MNDLSVLDAGDAALVMRLSETIDPAVNARVLDAARRVRDAAHPAIREVVTSFSALTLYFDPLAAGREDIAALLTEAVRRARSIEPASGRQLEIPVRYGGSDGPDLAEVASFAGCAEEEVVRRHLARPYRVFMLGFLPGFPYMGTLDDTIAMPRRESPRLTVPAGSVAIAERQTGVYPVSSPGGWRIIGRTDLVLFDPERTEPSLLQPGDSVRFTGSVRR
jgi:KipI family sensor histidine kinase inhibitor